MTGAGDEDDEEDDEEEDDEDDDEEDDDDDDDEDDAQAGADPTMADLMSGKYVCEEITMYLASHPDANINI